VTSECNPETGACELPQFEKRPVQNAASDQVLVSYVGDPMCSWCWGMSPVIEALAAHCAAQGLGFRIVMGGLRAGGGDPWNAAFRDFLRREWTHIAKQTGQPFGFHLLERSAFNYDTEPACRAVVAARGLNSRQSALRFFAEVQRKFYVEGEDPKETVFYRDICRTLGIDFAAFEAAFLSPAAIAAVHGDFALTRQLGVTGFPSVVMQSGTTLKKLSVGYAPFETLADRLSKGISN